MNSDLAPLVPFDIVASKHLLEARHELLSLLALQHGDLAQGIVTRPQGLVAEPDGPFLRLFPDG